MRRQLELDNVVAAELAGSEDAVLRALEGHLDCDVFLRGQRAHPGRGGGRCRGGGARRRASSPSSSPRATRSLRGRSRPLPRALDAARVAGRDPRGRRVAPPRDQGRPEDGQPEALRRLDPPQHDHLRDRPGGHRQDIPRRRAGRGGAQPARGQPDHPHPACGRGRRAARLPARRPDGQGRSRTCARCSTPCTTCSSPSGSASTWSAE